MRCKVPVGLLLVALLPLTVPPVHAEDSYSLKRVFRAGDVDTYHYDISLEGDVDPGEPGKGTARFILTETTREVRTDGSAVIVVKIASGALQVGREKAPLPWVGQTITRTLDSTGKVVSTQVSSPSLSQGLPGVQQFTDSTLPDLDALRLGQEVAYEPQMESKPGWKTAATAKLVGLDKPSRGAPRALKLRVTMDTTTDGVPPATSHVEETSFYEIGTGKRLRGEATFVMTKWVDGAPQRLRMTLKCVRLRAEPRAEGKQ